MNITNLASNLCFSNIFDNNKNKDGTYNWFNISKISNLPISFIDKYFLQIYSYGNLEKSGNLSEFIINKYGNYLNWNILLMHQNISEELLTKFQSKINWKICASTQKLSLNFLKANYQKIDIKSLEKNFSISKEIILDFKFYLDSFTE